MGALSDPRRRAITAHRNQPFLTRITSTSRIEFTGALFEQWVAKTANYLEAEFGRELQLHIALRAHWLWPVMLAALDELEGTAVPLDRADLLMCEGFSAVEDIPILAVHDHPMAMPFREPLPPEHHDFFLEVRSGADTRTPGPSHSMPLFDDGVRVWRGVDLIEDAEIVQGDRVAVITHGREIVDERSVAMLGPWSWSCNASLVISDTIEQLRGEKPTVSLELPG